MRLSLECSVLSRRVPERCAIPCIRLYDFVKVITRIGGCQANSFTEPRGVILKQLSDTVIFDVMLRDIFENYWSRSARLLSAILNVRIVKPMFQNRSKNSLTLTCEST